MTRRLLMVIVRSEELHRARSNLFVLFRCVYTQHECEVRKQTIWIISIVKRQQQRRAHIEFDDSSAVLENIGDPIEVARESEPLSHKSR